MTVEATRPLSAAEQTVVDVLAGESECSWHVGCDRAECHEPRARAAAAAVALELGRDCVRDGLSAFLHRLVGQLNAHKLLADVRSEDAFHRGEGSWTEPMSDADLKHVRRRLKDPLAQPSVWERRLLDEVDRLRAALAAANHGTDAAAPRAAHPEHGHYGVLPAQER